MGDLGAIPTLGWEDRRKWQPIPVFLPEKSYGQRSVAGLNPWGSEESDTTEQTSLSRLFSEALLDLSLFIGLVNDKTSTWACLYFSLNEKV